ncbi:MAG TPA: methionine--tRNA ligase [Mycobacteriales bacterium]|nr:methionine--tRNA ligase [Mycobacteriales bacterium]
MVAQKAFYVTTPIYYVNDVPHIGHAYTTVAGDVLARWHRQRGERVHFLTGTDEHGEKILTAAAAHGMTPQQWCDHMVETAWLPMLAAIDVANDDFIRTTEPRHTERVQEFLQLLYDKGEVYKGTYTGPYCVACEEFKLPSELVDGVDCPVHGRPVNELSEDNYFFRLSAYTPRLLEHYARHPEFVQPESARNEVVRFVEGGLQDLSLSRSTFDWGVQVPWDPSHVVYVWIDALQNYITAVGWNTDPEQFERTWPADVHLVGKDILRFHAVIWPTMLMAAGLALPRTVFANGWLLVGGEKMSKTKLTGIPPQQVVDHFGSDAYRYYFLRELSYGQDGSFSWESMAARYTSELANDFGNLVSRLAAMVVRYRGGRLPAPVDEPRLSEQLAATARVADERMRALDFQGGLDAVFAFVKAVNGYVTEQQPWVLAKDPDRARDLDRVLYAAADSLRALAVLLNPVMPKASGKLWASLGAEEHLGPLAGQLVQDAGDWGRLPAGATVTKTEVLFPRLEDSRLEDSRLDDSSP